MARARNIKPGIMENEDMADLDPIARLLFIYLWMLADREGRLEDRPRKIKAKALPYDSVDAEQLLDDLQAGGFIARYEVGGSRYIQIINFLKHQKPHSNENESKLPPWPDALPTKVESSSDEGEQDDEQESEVLGPCISDSLIPDSLIACENQEANASVDSGAKAAPSADLLGDCEGNGEVTGERSVKGIPPCPVQQIVDLYQAAMPENPRVRVVDDSRKNSIRARWVQVASLYGVGPFGYSTGAEGLEAWKAFFEVCAQSDFLTGKAKPLPGKPPFVADIGFLVSPSGFKKCLENKYHREVKE
ncbi:MAG: Phage protein [uncultured Paraburkholderia sp.]|nr:MAG: Phage protein [uncultured Paraburkholderia sp.]